MDYEQLPCRGKFCGRPGLPILPLRVAYVPNGVDNLPAAMHMAPDLFFNPMQQGKPMLRTITEGFVFTYDPRPHVGWRVFAATPTGRFKELLIADDERPTEAPTFACTRDGHNLEASLINVEGANKAEQPVWVGYTRAWWTRKIRTRLKDNADFRKQHMTPIDAKALYGGAAPNPEDGFKVDEAGAKLTDHILEYGDFRRAGMLYAYTRAMAVDRTREAASLAKRMYALAPKGGIVLALRDPIGVAQDISHWRNYNAGLLAQYQLESKRLREHVVADLILGLEGQLKDTGKMDEWPRYQKHVDIARVRQVRRDYKAKVAKLEQPIVGAAEDWAIAFGSDRFWRAWQTYDGDDREVGSAMEREFAASLDGAGAVKAEQEVLDKVLAAEPDHDFYGALWLAFAAGDKDVIDFLKQNTSKLKKVGKSGQKAVKEFKDWLAKRRLENAVRSATVPAAVLGRTIASQLARAVTANSDLASVLGTRIKIVAAARVDVMLTPYSYNASIQQVVVDLYETTWGPPTQQMSQRILEARKLKISQSLDGRWLGTQIRSQTLMEMEVWLPDEVIEDITPKARAVNLPGGAPPLALPGPTPGVFRGMFKWIKTFEGAYGAFGAVMATVSIADTLRAYQNAGIDKDDKAQNKALFGLVTGLLGLGAAAGSIVAAVTKARISKTLIQSESARLFMRVGWAGLAGGALATGAATAEGIQLLVKSYGLFREGDTAASAYGYSGAIFIVAGLTGAATAIIAAGSALASAGVTAASGGLAGGIVGLTGGGAVLLGIPVWGWIVLGIAAVIAGLYFLFRGSEEEDTPLEKWLSCCILRNESHYAGTERTVYASTKEELDAFNVAIFGLKITFEWKSEIGRDRLTMEAIMPGYTDSSEHAYCILLNGKGRRVVASRDTSAFSDDPDLKPQPPTQAVVRAAPEPTWSERLMDGVVEALPSGSEARRAAEKLRDRSAVDFVTESPFDPAVNFQRKDGYAVLSSEMLIDEELFDSAKLKFEYWPDAVNSPELRMVPVPGGANYQIARDGSWVY